jgi:protein-tyrosine phosphatase
MNILEFKNVRTLASFRAGAICSILWMSLLIVSCRVRLPEKHYERSLPEKNYVENVKDSYTLHLSEKAERFRIGLMTPGKEVSLNTPENARDSSIVIKKMPSRPTFRLVSSGDTTVVSNRQIYFNNNVNFRDLGGLRTTDGRTVKWGRIFRSDNLAKLGAKEFGKFNDLHIQSVYDMRTNQEIEGREDQLPSNVKYIHAPVVKDNEGQIAQLRKQVIGGKISEAEAQNQTAGFYRDAVTVNLNSLRAVIEHIIESNEPVLYHCSAGKDRTGIVSALILSILRVDRQTLVNEYLMSNFYRRMKTEKMLGKAKFARIIKPKMDLKAIEVFMTVDKEFIDATFDEIDKKYGGIAPFIKNQLMIDTEAQNKLIAKFTY